MPKRTFKPSKKRRTRTHGFRARIKSQKGKKVLKRRITRGRKKIIP